MAIELKDLPRINSSETLSFIRKESEAASPFKLENPRPLAELLRGLQTNKKNVY